MFKRILLFKGDLRIILDKKEKYIKELSNTIRIMEAYDWEVEKVKKLIANGSKSPRRHHPVEGLPSDPKARHTCRDCHRKRYEEDMIATGSVKENNWKAWMIWRCKECPEVQNAEKFII